MDDASRAIYSISAVSKVLGVPVATLRTWEDRYGLVVPERNAGGHRLYTRHHVEQLMFVKARMDRGVGAADAHRLLREHIETERPLTVDQHRPAARLLILVAESDRYAAEFQEYFLKTEGYEVDIARDCDAARAIAQQTLPSLVVIELLISGGLGLALCRQLKQADPCPLVLAVSSLDTRDQALDAGADAFLVKPLDPLLFVSTVKDLLGSSAFLVNGGDHLGG